MEKENLDIVIDTGVNILEKDKGVYSLELIKEHASDLIKADETFFSTIVIRSPKTLLFFAMNQIREMVNDKNIQYYLPKIVESEKATISFRTLGDDSTIVTPILVSVFNEEAQNIQNERSQFVKTIEKEIIKNNIFLQDSGTVITYKDIVAQRNSKEENLTAIYKSLEAGKSYTFTPNQISISNPTGLTFYIEKYSHKITGFTANKKVDASEYIYFESITRYSFISLGASPLHIQLDIKMLDKMQWFGYTLCEHNVKFSNNIVMKTISSDNNAPSSLLNGVSEQKENLLKSFGLKDQSMTIKCNSLISDIIDSTNYYKNYFGF